ncbi:MAG TPA: NADH:flavin oxidoreductase, partial [Candidatus Eisenbacteria bacterium]|nr:NADH:flavin oxidoreductase [Candidatus Eisenbacteria bacterium]
IEADTVVLALGVTPRRKLVDEFRKEFPNAHVIGDANNSGSIQEAIHDGFQEAFVFTSIE